MISFFVAEARKALKARQNHARSNFNASRTPALARRRVWLRRLVNYYKPHLGLLAGDVASALVIAACSIALPLMTNRMLGPVLQAEDTATATRQIISLGAAMLALVAVELAAIFFVDYRGHLMGARMEARIRQDLFDQCQRLSFGFYDRNRTGQLMSRITNDCFWLGELFHHAPEDLCIALLKFLGAMAVLITIDPPLALLVLTLTPVAVLYALHFNGRMNAAMAASKTEIAAVNEQVEDSLAGIRVVQAFANEALERRRFGRLNGRFLESRREGYKAEALFSLGAEGFAQLLTALTVILGAARVASADLSVADVLTVLLCLGMILDPLRRMTNLIRLFQEGVTGFVRAMEILDLEPEVTDRSGAKPLAPPKGGIEFRSVRFSYDGDSPPIFKSLDLTIRPGEFVALVGPSGAGKSTLSALIPRFYDVDAGAILIDGTDIAGVSLASLRRHVGLVQQDVTLFAGTVADNLRYGRPGASDAEVEAAARAADAHDFIMALPQGYDTDIGQRGVRLSGGQRQRLTIARAFLKDPAILIFDEATSALDNDSERAVQAALLNLARGRTTLVIAHRLSTVRHADRILVLSRGHIVEQGTHDALMRSDGIYAGLHRVQARI